MVDIDNAVIENIKADLIGRWFAGEHDFGNLVKHALHRVIEEKNRHSQTRNCYVLILNQNQGTGYSLTGVEFSHDVSALDKSYKVFVFKSGWVDHRDRDGGWVNWAYTGGHNDNGYVTWE